MSKPKNILKIILPIVLISSSAFVLFKNQDPIQNFSSDSDSQNTNINSDDQDSNNIVFQKLTILGNRCLGCGKCVRVDSSHFEMNGQTAKVISSTNLNSSNLQSAINICPGQAIVLE